MVETEVSCSRCGATFDSQDELVVHSIDTHADLDTADPRATGGSASASGTEFSEPRGAPEPTAEASLDQATIDELTAAIEAQSTSDLTVRYRQRFLAVAGIVVLGLVLAVSYLHLTGVLGTAVYMFSLGTLFGLTLSYLQAFLQTVR